MGSPGGAIQSRPYKRQNNRNTKNNLNFFFLFPQNPPVPKKASEYVENGKAFAKGQRRRVIIKRAYRKKHRSHRADARHPDPVPDAFSFSSCIVDGSAKAKPTIGPIKGEISMAPITALMLSVFRPTSDNHRKPRIKDYGR